MRFAVAVLLVLAAGCDPEPMMDGGLDGAVADAGPDAGRDANPPMCDPACPGNQTCCEGFVGPDQCFDLRNDVTHCGTCGADCLATNRGDDCMNSNCACGSDVLGCLGTRESFCCPARNATSRAYCANLDTSPADCGGCNEGCNPLRADRCDGGRCQCGPDRGQCDGTPESTCCRDGADVMCVDTTTDTFHCGGCGIRCFGGERCEDGVCVRGESCDDTCTDGDICCNGSCCQRIRCEGGTICAGLIDGGAPDAGPDAGPLDAGPDAGEPDAGPDAG